MNLIQAFSVCVFDVEEALSVVCEGLGDAPETTASFSGILEQFVWRWPIGLVQIRSR